MPKHLPVILCFILSLLFVPRSVWGQNNNRPILEFGNIETELFDIDHQALYPESDAIMLNDLGRVSILMLQNSPNVIYTYIRRIKILTEEGKKYATASIEIDESKGEGMVEFTALSHKLNASGEPVSFPVNRRKIKEERIKGVKKTYTFEFPFVEVGSIIEFTYKVKGREWDQLRSWKFHQDIPVLQSEFQTFIPEFLDYLPIIKGDRSKIFEFKNSYRAKQNQDDYFKSRINRSTFTYDRNNLYGGRSLFGNFNAFIMINVPSLQKEAFSLDSDAEGNQISLQLKKDRTKSNSNAVVFDDWAGLNKQMLKRYKSNKVKAKKKRISLASSRLKKEGLSTRATIEKAFHTTKKQIKWNGEYGVGSLNIERALNKREGNSSEVNMYLYHLLKDSGLDVYPVMLSTRDHGRVNPRYASIAQFNHVIVLAMIEGEEILMDASSDIDRMGMLPQNDLNQFGYILNSDGGRWIALKSHNKVNRVTYSRFNLNDKGQLLGEISVENREYSVVLEQKKLEGYKGKDEEYLLEEILIGLKDPKIFEKKLDIPEDEKDPLIVSCELRTGDYVEVASEGEIIILKPMMIKAVLQNPFENKIRNTPVDFPYPLTDSHMIGIRLPEGYEIAQIPAPIRVVLPNNGGSFTYNVLTMGNIIHFTSAIHINQTTYPPEEYGGIRSFFEYVVSKHQEDIVLRKMQ